MTNHLRSALAAATILGTSLLAGPTLAAAPVAAFDPNGGAPAAAVDANAAGATAPADLRRFALEAKELSFSGENRRLDFPMFVTAAESAVPAKLVLDFDNAISVLPETSRMVVVVNDTVVAEAPLGRSGRQHVAADLPSGLLQPGFNGVRVLVQQQHRVDCSLAGTYELWTAIDPATSGFVFAGATRQPANLGELPSIAPGADGRIHLRGVVGSGAGGEAVDATMSAIQSAVLLGYFDAPVVDFSDRPGAGPGLDVVVGTASEVAGLVGDAQGNTSIPFVTLRSSPDALRQTLVVSGTTTEDVRENLAAFVALAKAAKPAGPVAGQRSLAMFQGRALESGETVSFAELGVDARPFAGRFYHDDFRFRLPADFYAADYDYASIALDASFAGGLSPDAQLIIRANDAVVTTLSLGSSKAGQIAKQRMRVPLETLKPGMNVISLEAQLPKAADATCASTAPAGGQIRFSLSDTSSLSMPRFARVGHAPDISSMTAGIAEANRAEEKRLTLLVPNYDRPLLGAAATFVAKIASATRRVQPVHTISLMPLELEDDLVAFGSMAALPSQLFSTVRVAQVGGVATGDAAENRSGPSLVTAAAAETAGGASLADPAAPPSVEDAAAVAAEPPVEMASLGAAVRRGFDDLGTSAGWAVDQIRDFAFAQTSPDIFTPAADAALTVAQMPSPNTASSTWTLVTAANADRIVSGVAAATERDKWGKLGGAVSELGADGTHVATYEATSERLYETQPRSFTNARLVLAGWFSRHTEQYLAAMIGTLLLLGFATALFLRSVGEKSS